MKSSQEERGLRAANSVYHKQVSRLRLYTLAALLFAIVAVWAARADCEGCIATFCGTTRECPGGCVCAVPMGGATGVCVGTR